MISMENDCSFCSVSVSIYFQFIQQQQQLQLRRKPMEQLPLNILLPQTLMPLFLNEPQFKSRFELIHEIQDPYARALEISRDLQTEKRVAVRSYTAQVASHQHDVLQNMESFRKLGDEQGMCKLIAFTKNPEAGIISAAFQYNDFSIEELMQSRQYEKERYELYLVILRKMIQIISNAKMTGIIIDDIIPSCILLQIGAEFNLKILYDEREKRYEKIQQGIKVLASPEKIATAINQQKQYESEECQEAVFELGLLLLDFIYQFQSKFSSSQFEENFTFMKDTPIQKNIAYKGYLQFFHKQNNIEVQLNRNLVDQKIVFLNSLNILYINQFVGLVKKMIGPSQQRISFEQAYEEAQILNQVMLEAVRNRQKNIIDQNMYATPGKESINIGKQSINVQNQNKQTIRKTDEYNSINHNNQIKKLISQTTIASPYFTSTAQSFPKHIETISQTKVPQIIIAKESLLSKARKCTHLMPKFQQFMSKLQDRVGIVKKQYLDGSVYYGTINGNGKRDGYGVYISNGNEIYYGIWKENHLAQGSGTYLFQNGDGFEGVVKNGKQGFGRYYYSNGNIYQGEWRDDVKYGMGTMKYPNGDIYDGMWLRGKKNGQGKYIYHNNIIYVGNFVDGRKNGFGVITFPNGTKIEAYWNQTHIQGPGKVFYSNGNYFQGNYHLSEKDGKGLFKWEDTLYEGEFKKDEMEGHACIRFSEKEYYQGRIKNGRRNGRGLYHYSNDDEFQGDWKNDQKIQGLYKFREGGFFEGRFKNNELSYGKMIYQNGESYEGQFLRGQRQGLGLYRDSKGQILYQGKWQGDQFVAPL